MIEIENFPQRIFHMPPQNYDVPTNKKNRLRCIVNSRKPFPFSKIVYVVSEVPCNKRLRIEKRD